MDAAEVLQKLNELYPKNGFESQEEAINWTTEVKPLLRKFSNNELYETFNTYANYFSLSLSSETQIQAYNIMKSQLKTAIEELKLKVSEEKAIQDKYFPANSYLDVQKFISNLISLANNKLWVCDAYMDKLIIEELVNTPATEIKLLTKKPDKLFQERLSAARKQLKSKKIHVKVNNKIHDRYYILDEGDVWSFGTSYNKKAGGKPTSATKIRNDQQKIIDDFNSYWDKSAAFDSDS